MDIYNIYCDESCHLENDKQKAMVLGAIWCKIDCLKEINQQIRLIKMKHHIAKDFEIKWTKRSTYILFWTAYPITNEHNKRKLYKEYEEYKKAGGA